MAEVVKQIFRHGLLVLMGVLVWGCDRIDPVVGAWRTESVSSVELDDAARSAHAELERMMRVLGAFGFDAGDTGADGGGVPDAELLRAAIGEFVGTLDPRLAVREDGTYTYYVTLMGTGRRGIEGTWARRGSRYEFSSSALGRQEARIESGRLVFVADDGDEAAFVVDPGDAE